MERLWNFDGKTVTQVVTELNRHNDLKIDFDKSALRADTVIYGTLKLDDPMSFAQWLTADRNLLIDRRQPNVLLRTEAAKTANEQGKDAAITSIVDALTSYYRSYVHMTTLHYIHSPDALCVTLPSHIAQQCSRAVNQQRPQIPIAALSYLP